MIQEVAILGAGVALAAVMVALTIHCWNRALGEENDDARKELIAWAFRGLATPILFLVIWNSLVMAGWLDQVVPLMPGVVLNTRQYFNPGPAFAMAVGVTLLLVSSLWSAFALIRLVPGLPREDLASPELKWWLGIYAILCGLPAVLLLWWAGIGAVGFSVVILLAPVIHVVSRPRPGPLVSYAKAVGRMKRGHYAEAEAAVIAELEKREDDAEGWMMLATLYAENFHDLAGAEATVRELIEQPNLTPFQTSQALNRLADWQLKLARDPQAARRTLRELIARCEGTPFARTAEHRLIQLPLDQEELAAQQTPKRIRLPSLSDGAVEARPAERGSDRRESARREFDRLHVRLGLAPNDSELLERIAVLQAEELSEASQAIKTVEELLKRPDCPAAKVPVWLSHLATWHLKFRGDESTARALLERLIREFPGTPQAFGASSQLWTMEQRQLAASQPATSAQAMPKIVVRLPGTDAQPQSQ